MNWSISAAVQSDVIVDAPYVFELLNRCRSKSILSQTWNVLRYPVSMFFLMCAVGAFAQLQIWIGFFLLSLIYVGFCAARLANELAFYQIRNMFGVRNQRVEVGEAGIQSWSPLNPHSASRDSANSHSLNIAWQDVRRVEVFDDGVLFYSNSVYWVPDTSLRTPDEAKLLRELVVSHSRR